MAEDFLIKVRVDASGAARGVREVEGNLNRVNRAAEQTQRLLLSAFAAVGGIAAISSVVQFADQLTGLQNRLRLVTSGTENLTEVTAELFKISNNTRGSFQETASLYARLGLATQSLGISQQTLLEFTESLNQAVAISGASGASAAAGIFQLSQGLGAGALRGEELNSVLEQIPNVATVIAKSLGVTIPELRKLGEEGKITGEVVIEAFRKARGELQDQFASTIPTVAQAFTVLRNTVEESFLAFNNASESTETLAKGILALSNNLPTIINAFQTLAIVVGVAFARVAVGQAVLGLQALAVAIAANPIGALATAVTVAVSAFIAFQDQLGGLDSSFGELSDSVLALISLLVRGFSNLVNFISPVGIEIKDLGDAFAFLARLGVSSIKFLIDSLDFLVAATRAAGAALLNPVNALTAATEAYRAQRNVLNGLFETAKDVAAGLREVNQAAAAAPKQSTITTGTGSNALTVEQKAQKDLLESIQGPIREARSNLAALEALYGSGKISLQQYNSEKEKLLKILNGGGAGGGSVTSSFREEIQALEQQNLLLRTNSTERAALSQVLQIQSSLQRNLTEAEKQSVSALVNQNEQLERQDSILGSLRGPLQELQADQRALEQLYKTGAISLQEYNKVFNEFRLQQLSFGESSADGAERFFRQLQAEAQTAADFTEEALRGAFQSATSAIEEFANTGKFNFKSFADDVLKNINRIAAQGLSDQLAGLFGGAVGAGSGGGGGGLGGLLGGAASLLGFANGGAFQVGGSPGRDRNLMSINGRAVARVSRGETVAVSPSGVGMGRQPLTINMTINTPDADSFRRSETQIGNRISQQIRRASSRNG